MHTFWDIKRGKNMYRLLFLNYLSICIFYDITTISINISLYPNNLSNNQMHVYIFCDINQKRQIFITKPYFNAYFYGIMYVNNHV